jgi:hypothetical protein
LHLAQRRAGFGFVSAEHDKVVGITHDVISPLAHLAVESMQVEVGQEGADHGALRRAPGRCPLLKPVEYVRLEVGVEERQNAPVANARLHLVHEGVVGDAVEVALQVGIDHPVVAGLEGGVDLP